MRRLLGLVVLFAVLSMCVPSYGYFLIHNVSTTVKGADADTDENVTIALKGYLVLNLDVDGLVVDANLILYGKDYDKNKVYVLLNNSDIDGFLDEVDVWYVGDYMFVWFDTGGPFDFEVMLQGKTSLKDIGDGALLKEPVASLKGNINVWEDFVLGPSADQDVSGMGSMSAPLLTKITKFVNENDLTQDEILNGTADEDGLIEILEGKGYVAASLP